MEISCVSIGWIYYCGNTDLVAFNKPDYIYVEIFDMSMKKRNMKKDIEC